MKKMISLYQEVKLTNSDIKVVFTGEFKATGIVVDNFWVRYPGASMMGICESILTIPVLLNVAPAIWARGINVRIPMIDRELAAAFEKIKPVFKAMYPNLSWSGNIEADQEIDTTQSVSERSALFFSGGVDSVFTTMAHIKEKPLLLTVRGSDIGLEDQKSWHSVVNQSKKFARAYGLEMQPIESNFYEFLNQVMLGNLDDDIGGWWAGVQHGMGFAGLVAPISRANGLSHAFIASTHSVGFEAPWGSSPKIDNQIRYAGIQINHDGFEFTRHGKIREIISLVRSKKLSAPQLRVCYSNKKNSSQNCCDCEKCFRTMAALWVEKEDPLKFGFPVTAIDFEKRLKKKFSRQVFLFDENTLFMWLDIQKGLQNQGCFINSGLPSPIIHFLQWMREFDFKGYKAMTDIKQMRRVKVVNMLKKFPLLYRGLYVVRDFFR